ncbi:glycosyltransferase [Daejeonella lutea]|uniref:Chlorobactene glucosyltransferase n=1 Tax=Daejeonella lutea TaxID=572036 RepID=A0A1T5CS60_9SPHI|nr:glycosyltransferase family 2 protein [Daejeonella lutea]SKB62312.1 chlorobactene glucosyltransferase [Daejeonella lutea]
MILIYFIFFFLILRFTVTLFNFISNPKLTQSPREYDELVSILIPARDEENNILNLLESIRDQEYDNYEVIVLDDSSSDRTFEICEQFSRVNKRFRIVRGKELPKDWLGKNYACYQLAGEARGKFLMFLDADETIVNGLINNTVHRMKFYRLDLLSLFTNQVMVTLGERTIVPLMHYVLLNLLPLRLVRLAKSPAFSAASGQFMMFNADRYREYQWHEQVKMKVVEDIEIMRSIKAVGLRGEALLANGYIFCRMYTSFTEAFRGFSKNLLAGFNNNVIGLFLYLLLVILGPFAIAYILSAELLSFALSLIILSRIMISLMSGQNVWINILLHPAQLVSMLMIAIVSVKKYFTKTIVWKGRPIKN